MDKTSLVDKKTEAGRKLVEALDEATFPVRAALWYYVPEPANWRLVIASALVREEGPNEAYRRLQSVLMRHPEVSVELNDVWFVKDTDPFVELIAKAVRTPPDAIKEIRFSRNSVDGVFIDDALIYRSS